MSQGKLLLIILAAVLLVFSNVQAAYALSSIEVTSPHGGASYNMGSSIAITGQITLDETVAGATVAFSATSKKINKTIPIATRFYSFGKNTTVTFTQINKGTLLWAIPSDTAQSDDWQLYVNVNKEPNAIVDFASSAFTISKSLSISVSSGTYLLNLGEAIEASGTALDTNGNPITGNASVFLDHTKLGNVATEKIPITGGFFNFKYALKQSDPTGNYGLSFKITDASGNSALKILQGIVVSNKLALNCSIPEKQFVPGDEFDAIGNLKDIHEKPMDKVPIVAYLTFPSSPVSISSNSNTDANGNYAVAVQLPKLAEPGTYSFNLIAEDGKGNSGSCYRTFSLETERNVNVGVKMNSTWYYEKTDMGVEINIKNSGNVDLVGKISLLVDNAEVKSLDFAAKRGADTTLTPAWQVSGFAGTHTLSALFTSEGKVLTQTASQEFKIYTHPGFPKRFVLTPLHAFIIIGLVVIIFLLYFNRKEIRDYLWHWELKRKYGIGAPPMR